MTAREKVLNVEGQIRAMLDGEQTDFFCPYCHENTTEGNGILCCDESAAVINAFLDYIEHLDRCKIVDEVMHRFSANESRIILN